MSESQRQRDRQTQTDTERDKQTNRDRDTHTDRQTDRGREERETGREIRGERERQTDKERERQRETDTDREKHTHTHTHTHTYKQREADRQTDNQTPRELEHGRVFHAHSGFTVSTHLVVTSTCEIQAASFHAPFTVNETYEWLSPSAASLQYHSHHDRAPLSKASLPPLPASRGFSPRQHLSGDDPALNEFIRNSELYSYGAPCVSCALHAYVR